MSQRRRCLCLWGSSRTLRIPKRLRTQRSTLPLLAAVRGTCTEWLTLRLQRLRVSCWCEASTTPWPPVFERRAATECRPYSYIIGDSAYEILTPHHPHHPRN